MSLQYSDLVALLTPSSTLTFLDFSWLRSPSLRVHIRLSPDTAQGRRFALECTGEQGFCYAEKSLLGVGNKGATGEYVIGGAVNPNQMSTEPVQSLGNDDHQKSQFGITTKGNGLTPFTFGGLVSLGKHEGREFVVPLTVGAVWGWNGEDAPESKKSDAAEVPSFSFSSTLPRHNVHLFGKVENGLDILMGAAKVNEIARVTITDCGVVVPF